jgi:hypothetical protein
MRGLAFITFSPARKQKQYIKKIYWEYDSSDQVFTDWKVIRSLKNGMRQLPMIL